MTTDAYYLLSCTVTTSLNFNNTTYRYQISCLRKSKPLPQNKKRNTKAIIVVSFAVFCIQQSIWYLVINKHFDVLQRDDKIDSIFLLSVFDEKNAYITT